MGESSGLGSFIAHTFAVTLISAVVLGEGGNDDVLWYSQPPATDRELTAIDRPLREIRRAQAADFYILRPALRWKLAARGSALHHSPCV